MKEEQKYDVAVVGCGIIGLAISYFAAKKGKKVIVFDRGEGVKSASLNNFGLVWPIGQHPNSLQRALRSREIWLELAEKVGFWVNSAGSLTLAHNEDELHVLEEFIATRKNENYICKLLTPVKTIATNKSVNPIKLEGALWSATELNIDTRQALPAIVNYLKEVYEVRFNFNTEIIHVESAYLQDVTLDKWKAEQIYVCGGEHFTQLFPTLFRQSGLMHKKLRFIRTTQQPVDWSLGVALASGATLQNFPAFEHCESLALVKRRTQRELLLNGNVRSQFLVAQTPWNELIIGDCREFDANIPDEQQLIFETFLKNINRMVRIPSMRINNIWNGSYTRIESKSEFVARVSPQITIVNGLGGFGLTLAFGLAEELLEEKLPVESISVYGK